VKTAPGKRITGMTMVITGNGAVVTGKTYQAAR